MTTKAILINYKQNGDGYCTLVYQNLEEYSNIEDKYIWVVIPPRWKEVSIEIGEEVMLHYLIAKAGNSYYDSRTGIMATFKTSINWYKDSIPLNHNINKKLVLED